MSTTIRNALAVLALSLLSLTIPPSVAEAEEGGGHCVWCMNDCPAMTNHWCAANASGCSAFLIPCSNGCRSIYGTNYLHKLHCGSAEE
jgi:hypothetical protein